MGKLLGCFNGGCTVGIFVMAVLWGVVISVLPNKLYTETPGNFQ
jgi:hypothetical protein